MATERYIELECPYCGLRLLKKLDPFNESIQLITCVQSYTESSKRGCLRTFAVRIKMLPVIEYYRIDKLIREAKED